jgi:undecaprenyl-phosphate galactose phosphotransferase
MGRCILMLVEDEAIVAASRSWVRARTAIDPALAVTLLAVLLPLLSILALLVKLDGGPVFYGHRRVGRAGRDFRCWKFRTMVPDADRVLAELLARDVEAKAEWDRDFKLRRDPRVTWIGRVLRATSLDELPQLANVVRGEMGLIGPRPIVEEEIPRYGRHIVAYLSCRPGITGLWQVSGRNDVSYRSRVLLDCEYAKHQSPLLDLQILARTVKVVLRGRGAY